MTVQIQFRRGMASEWTAANPLLAQGEMGLEWDTGKFKVGTGSTYWNSLVYSSGQTGPQGPVGPSGSSNSIAIANQGSVLTSSTVYINFTGAGVSSSVTSGSVTVTVSGNSTASNSLALGGVAASAYALLAGANFTGASIGGLQIATQNYVTGLGYQTSSGSVNYATNSGSSTYSSSAGASPIPASVSYAASAGTANNSINLGGQASTYYYPASSINAASVAYATNAGNALTTSQTNFATLTISSSNVATQAFVTGQGYLTSSGSIATASNSASLGGQPASYYYPSASITNASVAYATNAGNSASTSQTNFENLTISGASVATQSYVNNKFFYGTIPFSVTGSVSTAGPWDYRFYNDTGGTRSINGVRASLGTAPSGSAMLIDVRKNGITGANSIFTASSISIPSGSTTSGLISSGFNSGSSVASGDYLTVAVTQVGSTTAGSDLVVQVMWS